MRASDWKGWSAASLLVLLSSACGPSASDGGMNVPGGNAAAPGVTTQGPQGGDSVAELKIRLDDFVERRQTMLEPASSDSGVCEDLCSLSASICDVKDKLCAISEERADQAEYRAMCREAQLECRDAQDSCIECVQTHSSGSEASAEPR